MNIALTNDFIEMEPGPNLHFKGSMKEFEELSKIIFILSKEENKTIKLQMSQNYFFSNENLIVEMKSKPNGRILSRISQDKVVMELDSEFWLNIYNKAVILSKKNGHIFIEFDSLNLVEDCNIIWSSVE